MAENDERAIAAAELMDEHMFDGRNDHGYDRCDCDWVGRGPGAWPDHLADVLETAGLLTDPEPRTGVAGRVLAVVQRDYERARLELRKLNDAMLRKNRVLAKRTAERDLALWLHAESEWWLIQYKHDVVLWRRQVTAAEEREQAAERRETLRQDERDERQARIDDVLAWLDDADGMELTRVGIDALKQKLRGDEPADHQEQA